MPTLQNTEKHPAPLSPGEVKKKLNGLDHWVFEEGAIHKDFDFDDYGTTLEFVNAVGWLANRVNHHPDMTFGFDNCRVSLRTHKSRGVTERDIAMAEKIEDLHRFPNED